MNWAALAAASSALVAAVPAHCRASSLLPVPGARDQASSARSAAAAAHSPAFSFIAPSVPPALSSCLPPDCPEKAPAPGPPGPFPLSKLAMDSSPYDVVATQPLLVAVQAACRK